MEYPLNEKVLVDFTPGLALGTSTAQAVVWRKSSGTEITLHVFNLPDEVKKLNIFAVAPDGKHKVLGTVEPSNGSTVHTFTTQLDQLMLILSPSKELPKEWADSAVAFRSNAPSELSVVAPRFTFTRTPTPATPTRER